jgi:quinol-cytochrome oxidoreductase complex cytochrome b subunit
MVIVVFLHMLRVFFAGAYRPPREFNWAVGVILLILTLLLSYTGYLLPWDQLAYWAVNVGANMVNATPIIGPSMKFMLLGGNSIGENALVRFYVLHCVVIPFFAAMFIGVHFWRVRKDGGVVPLFQSDNNKIGSKDSADKKVGIDV